MANTRPEITRTPNRTTERSRYVPPLEKDVPIPPALVEQLLQEYPVPRIHDPFTATSKDRLLVEVAQHDVVLKLRDRMLAQQGRGR